MVSDPESILPGSSPLRDKLWKYGEGPWFWGGIALIVGAAAASVSLAIIFIIGYVPISVGVVRADFWGGQTRKGKVLGNAGILIAAAIILFCIWKVIPRAKEPPSAEEIATAVKKKMEEKPQNVQNIQPSLQVAPPAIPKPKPNPAPKPVPPSSHQQPQQQVPQQQVPPQGHLVVSQSYKTSTRLDAPVETEVVVQSDMIFQTLQFVMQCSGPMVEAIPTVGAGGVVQMGIRRGVVKDHPNIMVYSYNSSFPPFGPANPLIIDVWSKEPITCSQVATF